MMRAAIIVLGLLVAWPVMAEEGKCWSLLMRPSPLTWGTYWAEHPEKFRSEIACKNELRLAEYRHREHLYDREKNPDGIYFECWPGARCSKGTEK